MCKHCDTKGRVWQSMLHTLLKAGKEKCSKLVLEGSAREDGWMGLHRLKNQNWGRETLLMHFGLTPRVASKRGRRPWKGDANGHDVLMLIV